MTPIGQDNVRYIYRVTVIIERPKMVHVDEMAAGLDVVLAAGHVKSWGLNLDRIDREHDIAEGEARPEPCDGSEDDAWIDHHRDPRDTGNEALTNLEMRYDRLLVEFLQLRHRSLASEGLTEAEADRQLPFLAEQWSRQSKVDLTSDGAVDKRAL